MSTEESLRVLSQALRLENEGLAFYLQAATETIDPKGKALFASLADDERKHQAMIRQQLHAVEGNGVYVLLPNLNVEPIDLAQPIFPPDKSDVEKRTGANPNELDVLFLAIDNEIKSYDLYRNAAQKASDPGKQMYQWLAAAEMVHFNLLMSNWEAISGNSGWV
jgi:rubrerythrin